MTLMANISGVFRLALDITTLGHEGQSLVMLVPLAVLANLPLFLNCALWMRLT